MPDQSRKWWANNWFNVLHLLFYYIFSYLVNKYNNVNKETGAL